MLFLWFLLILLFLAGKRLTFHNVKGNPSGIDIKQLVWSDEKIFRQFTTAGSSQNDPFRTTEKSKKSALLKGAPEDTHRRSALRLFLL